MDKNKLTYITDNETFLLILTLKGKNFIVFNKKMLKKFYKLKFFYLISPL